MSRRYRRGMMLVVVLIVLMVLTVGVLTLSLWMTAERHAAHLSAESSQTRLLAESGIEGVRALLAQGEQLVLEAGGHYDNPDYLGGVLVTDSDDPRAVGRFSVLSPRWSDDGRTIDGVRFGLEDESSRLNLHVLIARDNNNPGVGREILMKLPGMDEKTADSILDYLDQDDEIREFGAELEYYAALTPPYEPKNGPLDAIEELLLVRGVTSELLYGVDWNRNGLLETSEPEQLSFADVDNSDGSMNAGWAAYVTLHSRESALSSDGAEKINLNQEDLQALYDALVQAFDQQTATFVIAYRQNGPYQGSDEGQAPTGRPDTGAEAETELSSLFDLVGARTEARLEGQRESTVLASPLTDDNLAEVLPTFLDRCTISDEPIPGTISVNTASRTVLMTVPGMTDETADHILAERIEDPVDRDEDMQSLAWLLTREVIEIDELKTMAPYLCADGAVYRAQIVGFHDAGRRQSRLEAWIDTAETPPAVLFWKDLDSLGPGYPLPWLRSATSGTGTVE